MRRPASALLAASLTGCTILDRAQLLPIVNPNTYDVSCCVAYAEIPPATQLSLTVTHSGNAGTKVKAGARWHF